jgi:hypothetical protein
MVLTNDGKPDTAQLLLGRGHLMLDLFDTSDNPTLMMRSLGNASGFTLTGEEEIIEHFSSRAGLKKLDASATLTKSLKGTMTLEEISPENIALFGSATITEIAAESGSVSNDVWIPDDAGGYWVQIWRDAADTSPGPEKKQGTRPAVGINPAVAATISGSVENTDFEVDYARGRLYIIPAGNLSNTGGAWKSITYTLLAGDRRDIRLLNRTVVRGRLTFVSENAQTSEKRTLILNKIKMQASGDLQFISNEWASLAIEFTCEEDATNFPNSPVGSLHVSQT